MDIIKQLRGKTKNISRFSNFLNTIDVFEKIIAAIQNNEAIEVEDAIEKCKESHKLMKMLKETSSQTLLHVACSRDLVDHSIIETLLQNGAKVNAIDSRRETALDIAVRVRRFDLVECLLSYGAHFDPMNLVQWKSNKAFNQNLISMLYDSVDITNLHPIVKQQIANFSPVEVIQAGFDSLRSTEGRRLLVNKRDKNFSTLVYTACWYGRADVLEYLIDVGADLGIKNLRGNSPIEMALEKNHVEVVAILLQYGIVISNTMIRSMEKRLKRPVDLAIMKLITEAESERKTLGLLLAQQPIHKKMTRSQTLRLTKKAGLVSRSIMREDVQFIRSLAASKNCSARLIFNIPVDRYNNTVVHHAAMHGTSEIISYIIDNGGKLSNTNTKNQTPLLCALEMQRDEDIIELLILKKAKINLKDWTILQKKLRVQSHPCINQMILEVQNIEKKQKQLSDDIQHKPIEELEESLLEYKTSHALRILLNSKIASSGSTPIFTACWYKKKEVVQLLVKHGASVNIQNVRGNRAIHMAIEKNQDDIVQFLILHGAEVNLDELKRIKRDMKTNGVELSSEIEEIIKQFKNVTNDSLTLRDLQKRQIELKNKLEEREQNFEEIHEKKKHRNQNYFLTETRSIPLTERSILYEKLNEKIKTHPSYKTKPKVIKKTNIRKISAVANEHERALTEKLENTLHVLCGEDPNDQQEIDREIQEQLAAKAKRSAKTATKGQWLPPQEKLIFRLNAEYGNNWQSDQKSTSRKRSKAKKKKTKSSSSQKK